jgi:periplasmic protein TonB
MATNRAPLYPESARRRRIEGRVVLRVSVSSDGAPLNVAVLQGSGHDNLDEAAAAAVRQWRFVPATRGGVPVEAPADVPVQFRLEQ